MPREQVQVGYWGNCTGNEDGQGRPRRAASPRGQVEDAVEMEAGGKEGPAERRKQEFQGRKNPLLCSMLQAYQDGAKSGAEIWQSGRVMSRIRGVGRGRTDNTCRPGMPPGAVTF